MRDMRAFSESESFSLSGEAFSSQISLGRHEFLIVYINWDRFEGAVTDKIIRVDHRCSCVNRGFLLFDLMDRELTGLNTFYFT
jgi:hypothetical protein